MIVKMSFCKRMAHLVDILTLIYPLSHSLPSEVHPCNQHQAMWRLILVFQRRKAPSFKSMGLLIKGGKEGGKTGKAGVKSSKEGGKTGKEGGKTGKEGGKTEKDENSKAKAKESLKMVKVVK